MNPPVSYLHPDVRYSKMRAKFMELCDGDRFLVADLLLTLDSAIKAAMVDGDRALDFLRK